MNLSIVQEIYKNCSRKECENKNPQSVMNFYKNRSTDDGFNIHCKQCTKFYAQKSYNKDKKKYNAKTLEYRKRDPEKWIKRSRDNMLKREYGLTPEQWNDLFSSQNGCCKICNIHSSEIKKPLAVDHCHKSGKVRGLLCYHCNWLIGHAKDDKDILSSAIKYLEKNIEENIS